MRCVFPFVCLLSVLGMAIEVRGGDLKSPQGFSLTYPEGWEPASKQEVNQHGKIMSHAGMEMAAIIHGPSRTTTAQHLIVIIKPMPPFFATLDAATKMQGIESMAANPIAIPRDATNVKRQRQEICGTTAITLSYEIPLSNLAAPLRTWQVFLPGKEKIYIFRCSAIKSQWDNAWPTFKKMIDGVHIDLATTPQDQSDSKATKEPAAADDNSQTEGPVIGIGAVFVEQEDRVLVRNVYAGSPAEVGRIGAGRRIATDRWEAGGRGPRKGRKRYPRQGRHDSQNQGAEAKWNGGRARHPPPPDSEFLASVASNLRKSAYCPVRKGVIDGCSRTPDLRRRR